MNDLTLENLKDIYLAMNKIAKIDRSNFFNNYFEEVQSRIKEIELLEDIINKQIDMEVFKIYTKENKQFIERLIYPKFTIELNRNDLEQIEVHEEILDAKDLTTALREVDEFLSSDDRLPF